MKSYYSNFYTEKSDTHNQGFTNTETQKDRFAYFLSNFTSYYRIDYLALRNLSIQLTHDQSKMSHYNARFPKVKSRIEVEMHLWCESEYTIEVTYTLWYEKKIITGFRTTLKMVDNDSFRLKKIPQDISERIGPHIKKYSRDQLDALAKRF